MRNTINKQTKLPQELDIHSLNQNVLVFWSHYENEMQSLPKNTVGGKYGWNYAGPYIFVLSPLTKNACTGSILLAIYT